MLIILKTLIITIGYHNNNLYANLHFYTNNLVFWMFCQEITQSINTNYTLFIYFKTFFFLNANLIIVVIVLWTVIWTYLE